MKKIILIIFDSLRRDCVGAYGSPPWGRVSTPNFDGFAGESIILDRAYPESLPTLPTRRAIYTGRRVYPFHDADFRLKGDFVGAPGWGPIPEEQPTLAEILGEAGYRTGLISDVYHMFKPSKNFWRGFDQWTFLRGKEKDPARSGPALSQEEVDYWLPEEMQSPGSISQIRQCVLNMRDRGLEEEYFAPRVFREASKWLEQNMDADSFFLTVESFDPHGPFLVPPHYRKMYDDVTGREQIKAGYGTTEGMDPALIRRTRANYSGLVTLCDRWFGHFLESLRVTGLLEECLVIFTSDHGHSIGDSGYLGKRGYPSGPEIFRVPLMVRHPDGRGAGMRSPIFVQHTDISAEIIQRAGVEGLESVDGSPFFDAAVEDMPYRDHVTVAWGSAFTVINDDWWFNCKVNGKGGFLHPVTGGNPEPENAMDENPEIAEKLFDLALEDAGGGFPDWLVELADKKLDAPGCSDLVPRP